MFSKRLLSLTTVLMTLTLLTLTAPGCRKEFTDEPLNKTDQDLEFLGGGATCDNGVKVLQMFLQVGAGNKWVRLFNNTTNTSTPTENQNLNTPEFDKLLTFTATNTANTGTVLVSGQIMAVGPVDATWINSIGGEVLNIKMGPSANVAGWNMISAGLWITADAGSSVSIQMKKNGLNVQPPFTKSYASLTSDHILFSLFYQFDELEIKATSGRIRLENGGGTKFNRFIITNDSQPFVALRPRKAGYFWNSLAVNEYSMISVPNQQTLVAGNFIPTPNGDEWIKDGATTSFINKKINYFAPSTGANNDDTFDVGESVVFAAGSEMGGSVFTNMLIPIQTPSSGASVPRAILSKGGSPVATYDLSQQAGTAQYHLIGLPAGMDFDEIELTTGSASGTYQFFTDYWSVARFSFCPDGSFVLAEQGSQDN